MNEESFLPGLRNGDHLAFRQMVDAYRDRVFNTAIGFVQNREDAEDLTQDIFVEVYQSIGKFRGDSSLMTWIYRITVQKSLDHIRKNNRKKRSGVLITLFGKEQSIPVTASSPFFHPGIKLENKERAAILFRAIGNLPEKQRTAFTLHKLEMLSYEEIGKIMQLSHSSVESLIFRAKQNLKRFLAGYYEKK